MDRSSILVFLALACAACGKAETVNAGPDEKSLADAKAIAAQLKGDGKGSADDNPLCRLFTPKELAAYVGEPLKAGENAAMGTGCIWYAQDGAGDVLLQAAPKEYHADPYLAEGYRELPGVGEKGNVSPALGGWIAAAIVGEETLVASVTGKTGDPEHAEALLNEFIRRRTK